MYHKKRIIYLNNEGRLGHQLSQFLTLLAHCIENGYVLEYPSFQKFYLRYFEVQKTISNTVVSNKNPLLIYQLTKALLSFFKIPSVSLGRKTIFSISLDSPKKLIFDNEILDLISKDFDEIVFNHLLNDTPSLIRNKEKILNGLCVNPEIERKILDEIERNDSKSTIRVGVHIRRTDFAGFVDGKYFYSDEVYLNAMLRFLDVFRFNKEEVTFFICSDEKIQVQNFSSLNINYVERDSMQDFVLLKNMNYIIASRSIFSTMANFYGQNKIYQILDKDYLFHPDDFVTSDFLLLNRYNLKMNPDFII